MNILTRSIVKSDNKDLEYSQIQMEYGLGCPYNAVQVQSWLLQDILMLFCWWHEIERAGVRLD